MLIYKEALPNSTNIVPIKLPFENIKEAKENILHLDRQNELPCMWFNAVQSVSKEFVIICIRDGHCLDDITFREEYIGTVIMKDNTLVWHYFLVEKDVFDKRIGK